ncbi:MAG: hypothetical protein LBB15_02865 [Puniceicoccales bacterium]|jgi:hypothetical protein|nr:hypothetical protein [Puniceicoccales bacterium]
MDSLSRLTSGGTMPPTQPTDEMQDSELINTVINKAKEIFNQMKSKYGTLGTEQHVLKLAEVPGVSNLFKSAISAVPPKPLEGREAATSQVDLKYINALIIFVMEMLRTQALVGVNEMIDSLLNLLKGPGPNAPLVPLSRTTTSYLRDYAQHSAKNAISPNEAEVIVGALAQPNSEVKGAAEAAIKDIAFLNRWYSLDEFVRKCNGDVPCAIVREKSTDPVVLEIEEQIWKVFGVRVNFSNTTSHETAVAVQQVYSLLNARGLTLPQETYFFRPEKKGNEPKVGVIPMTRESNSHLFISDSANATSSPDYSFVKEVIKSVISLNLKYNGAGVVEFREKLHDNVLTAIRCTANTMGVFSCPVPEDCYSKDKSGGIHWVTTLHRLSYKNPNIFEMFVKSIRASYENDNGENSFLSKKIAPNTSLFISAASPNGRAFVVEAAAQSISGCNLDDDIKQLCIRMGCPAAWLSARTETESGRNLMLGAPVPPDSLAHVEPERPNEPKRVSVGVRREASVARTEAESRQNLMLGAPVPPDSLAHVEPERPNEPKRVGVSVRREASANLSRSYSSASRNS